MGFLSFVLQIMLLAAILGLIYLVVKELPASQINQLLNISSYTNPSTTVLAYPITTIKQNFVPQNQILIDSLALINRDRHQFGLANVSFSNITSGQQHAQSMLNNGYFSHWDIYGMKPYMRYTLLGGRGSVDENVAYMYNSGGINVLDSVAKMENSMMYNDSACCNNGHRDNILDPNHNQVSIGIAYNTTTIYLTEDFIDDYVTWFYGTPSYGGGNVNLQGAASSGYSVYDVEVSYDGPVANMTHAQLKNTSHYSYGDVLAGIGYASKGRVYSFPNLTTINATTYTVQGNDFDIAFGMNKLIAQKGAGEYTVMLWLYNTTSGNGQPFIGATYTMFINSSGVQYTPSNV